MKLSMFMIVIGQIIFTLQNCKFGSAGVDWNTAHEHCRSKNDSLPDIHDVQNHLSHLKGLRPIWSLLKGHFTPWIAYRGCFREFVCNTSTGAHLTKKTCHILQNNTVGNCYFECKSKNYSYGGCANNVNFFFGLQKSMCFCLCDITIMTHLSESAKCNISCGTSITNGECGGIDQFSMYESINVSLPDTHFGGFCLICRKQNDPKNNILYSIECNEKARGHCVMNNGSVFSTLPRSTYASYWTHCKNRDLYIVGDSRLTFCQKENNTWTGLRKYKIDNSKFDNYSCYIIETNQKTVNYKKSNCTQKLFFLCKKDIRQKNVPSPEYIRNTKSTASPALTRESSRTTYKSLSNRPVSFPATSKSDYTSLIIATSISPSPSRLFKSEQNTGTIVGVSIAGIAVLISVVFLTMCLLKRNKFQCLHSKQQQAKRAKVFHNTTYDDLVVTNHKPEVNYANTILENGNRGSICKIEDIYVEKEEEYDHLHTSRQKHVTTQIDDDRYGTASYLEEGSYSTLRQNKNTESHLEYGYSVNTMPYLKHQSGLENSSDYN